MRVAVLAVLSLLPAGVLAAESTVLEWVDALEPVVIGVLILLGGGQIYLWTDNRKLGDRITRVEAEQTATGRTLGRIDKAVQDTKNCVHSIDNRLARMEGPKAA